MQQDLVDDVYAAHYVKAGPDRYYRHFVLLQKYTCNLENSWVGSDRVLGRHHAWWCCVLLSDEPEM